ncbi:Sel1 repeat-containing protein [Nitzschia inconspicua]|uniref:Sel1 repeat-containing protein n=1 Tax=Nitzschia inconspicua TaxID=303405 RepID=A0A9K3P953_9STRA|nr:Sel1 repeat-containing protein [Nitzschia inconspicua]KAG7362679.1 Sel1 repeat-containing protein [Nitzschia inconspicua]
MWSRALLKRQAIRRVVRTSKGSFLAESFVQPSIAANRTLYSTLVGAVAVATVMVFSIDEFDRSSPLTGSFAFLNGAVTACEDPSDSTPLDKEIPKEKAARLFRKRTTLQVATSNGESTQSTTKKGRGMLQRFSTQQELEKLRAMEKEMMQRWERDEEGWRQLPARAWPEFQPNPEQLQGILENITIHNCDLHGTDQCGDLNSPTVPAYIRQCTNWLFQMATTFVFYNVDPQAGLEQFERLAKRGHVDSMVACGIILVEGLGVPPKEKEGLVWLEKAAEKGSAQGYYELGTVYYTGIDGVVEEDVNKAFILFEKAAEQDHTAAIYMVADCLVEGEGTERSLGRAIPLFYKAAERGHRFSRQRIRELLARIDYPL